MILAWNLDQQLNLTSVTKQCQKIDNDILPLNCDVIIIFPIYGQFGAMGNRIMNAWTVQPTFSLIVTFYLTNTENRTKKSLTQLSQYCFD